MISDDSSSPRHLLKHQISVFSKPALGKVSSKITFKPDCM